MTEIEALIRPLDDIRTTGAAWITEAEVEWMASEIERLRVALHRLIDAPRYPCDELHDAFRRAEKVAR